MSEGSISLSWDAPYDAVSFKIYRDAVFLVETSDQTYDDTIDGGIQYCYTISAVNSVAIEGPQSGEQCGVPLLPAPGSFSATVNYDDVILNWSEVENAAGYTVYRDDAVIWNGSSSNVTYSDSDVNYNTTYLYTIRAYDFQGTNGSISDPISVTTPEELTAPILSLTVTGTEATLSWSLVSSAESYKVYQDDEFLAQITDLTDLTYTLDIGTGSNTCFKVTAINSYGTESSPSNEECGTGS